MTAKYERSSEKEEREELLPFLGRNSLRSGNCSLSLLFLSPQFILMQMRNPIRHEFFAFPPLFFLPRLKIVFPLRAKRVSQGKMENGPSLFPFPFSVFPVAQRERQALSCFRVLFFVSISWSLSHSSFSARPKNSVCPQTILQMM